ncbi:response regulator [Kordiimonas sp.]|uniref:response regulator n=1 Tax=Kordiimonas sp. TaxID=1970157 RepID=UPI003A8C9382
MTEDDPIGSASSTETIAAALLHQLRTPLLTIKTLSELIPDSAEQGAALRADINRQVDRINAELDAFWAQLAGDAALEEAGAPASVAGTTASFRILYVDDDQIHRDIGLRLLEKLGHEVVVCADGVSARDLCEKQDFDIIFLDEYAPVIRGTDLARGWADATGGHAPPYMVGMSNDPRLGRLKQACLDAGMQDFMAKPVTAEKLANVLALAETRLQAGA